jgi:hypothetical protein
MKDNVDCVLKPFHVHQKKLLVISPQGFSALEKKRRDMFSEDNAAHLATALYADSNGRFELAGSDVAACC